MAKNMSSADVKFKKAFVDRYSNFTNWDEFSHMSLQFLRRSIRINTLKKSVDEIKKRLEKDWNLLQGPWCKEGFWIEHKGEEKRRDIGMVMVPYQDEEGNKHNLLFEGTKYISKSLQRYNKIIEQYRN